MPNPYLYKEAGEDKNLTGKFSVTATLTIIFTSFILSILIISFSVYLFLMFLSSLNFDLLGCSLALLVVSLFNLFIFTTSLTNLK